MPFCSSSSRRCSCWHCVSAIDGSGGRGLVGRRLSVILESRKVPYAVPMGLSAWIVIALRGI